MLRVLFGLNSPICYDGPMIVVTSGARYIDIDAYACCVAYAELLNILNISAVAASSAVWNESIPRSIRALGAPFSTTYRPGPEDEFVIVDLSDPSKFDGLVELEQVVEVFDHHPGFEQYWQDRLGSKSNIEFIGAAATLIYEQWKKAGKREQMSKASAKLLVAAILDNTLNFGASVTTRRDTAAYTFLAEYANLDDAWAAHYFTECQDAIQADVSLALRNDTKFLTFNGLDHELCFGQLVVWDAKRVLDQDLVTIDSVLATMSNVWMANIVSISDGKSYFVTQNEDVKQWAANVLDIPFDASVVPADRLWLRKEVMKAAAQVYE
jgi:inorganic pyrophosphatase